MNWHIEIIYKLTTKDKGNLKVILICGKIVSISRKGQATDQEPTHDSKLINHK